MLSEYLVVSHVNEVNQFFIAIHNDESENYANISDDDDDMEDLSTSVTQMNNKNMENNKDVSFDHDDRKKTFETIVAM
jgi:hypothetical protein